MYQFAYPVIADELPQNQPLSHSQKLSLAQELIEAADEPALEGHQRQWTLSEFRRIWLSIANDLNAGPVESQRAAIGAVHTVVEAIGRMRALKRGRFASRRKPVA
jgi:flagellar biosynthesis regulator FlaF